MKFAVRHPLKLLKNLFKTNNFKGNLMLNVNQTWKQLHKSKKLESKHVVQRAILRSLLETDDPKRAVNLVLRDLMKSFAPRTNKNALDNGYNPLQALNKAIFEATIEVSVHQRILNAPSSALGNQETKYLEFVRELWNFKDQISEYYNRKYVYIFVRQDISPEYQLVQAAHAALRCGYDLCNQSIINWSESRELYFTVVGVKDQQELIDVQTHMKERNIHVVNFQEPDIGNELTAIATEPIPIRERGDLLKYKLLRFNRVVD